MFTFSLIYNEIIIIKLFSLEKYTAKYISIREKNEYENLDQVYNDDKEDEFNNRESINSQFECEMSFNEK